MLNPLNFLSKFIKSSNQKELDRISIIVEKVNSLNDNFSTQILTENIKMLEAFDVIQQGVVRLKTNMLSILGISVDYYDADGD